MWQILYGQFIVLNLEKSDVTNYYISAAMLFVVYVMRMPTMRPPGFGVLQVSIRALV
jgi:hypothetical protein